MRNHAPLIIASFIVSLIATSASAQQCLTTKPPKDAIVLVKGSDNSLWKAHGGGEVEWPTDDGILTANKHSIMTRQEFGDVQLHIEFQIPPRTKDSTRGHGNSGVYLHGDYELQVIDSYNEDLHYRHSCGSIYQQHAPMAKAALPAGEWQSFDVMFRAPDYDKDAKPIKNARMSVIHNGVWIHDNVECVPTPGALTKNFKHTGPIWLQIHGHPVRYRNIWIRELKQPTPEEHKKQHSN